MRDACWSNANWTVCDAAQTLAPAIAELLGEAGWRAGDVQLVAVATGPGSFTGLRIGVTTGKAFAYGVGCPVVGVHTLMAIAWQVPLDVRRFSVVLDAQRDELYVAEFARLDDRALVEHEATRVVACEMWLESLAAGSVVTGPGLTKMAARLPGGVVAVDAARWAATAASVGAVGWKLFSAGCAENAFTLLPQYFRPTAAEEQWNRNRPQ